MGAGPTAAWRGPATAPSPAAPRRGRGLVVALAALAWGFAEATLFFVVPDVLLTFLALRSWRRAALACVLAVAGALAGGALMHRWSVADAPAAIAAVDAVPFVPADLVARVEEHLARDGAAAIVAGAWMGRPYKLYAVQASRAGIGGVTLLAVTVPARLLRFAFLAALAHAVARFTTPRWGWRTTVALWAAAWTLEYAVYWIVMSR